MRIAIMRPIGPLTPSLILFVMLGAFAPSSAASPAPRGSTVTRVAKRTPPPHRDLKLSPELRARLSAATVTQKPIRFEPISSKDVRENVPARARPMRANTKGKLKPISNVELTDELNAIERKLNGQGYSLRDNRTVAYHEHKPSRVKLEQQVQRVREVASVKPERAPLTVDQLRLKVRGAAKPPRARAPLGSGAINHGMWTHQGSSLHAESDFKWTPSMGEPDTASAFIDTRVHYSGDIDGFESGLHANAVVQAGAYIFGNRVDVARIDARADATVQEYEVDVTATLANAYEYPLFHRKQSNNPLAISETIELFDYGQTYSTPLGIVGFPVLLEVTVSSALEVSYDAMLGDAYLIGGLEPQLRVEASAEVFIDMILASAGAGGKVLLVEAAPDLWGYAYFGEQAGKQTINTYVGGTFQVRFLEGRLYLFLELGFWPFELRFEHELWEYEGWEYKFPLSIWDHAVEL